MSSSESEDLSGPFKRLFKETPKVASVVVVPDPAVAVPGPSNPGPSRPHVQRGAGPYRGFRRQAHHYGRGMFRPAPTFRPNLVHSAVHPSRHPPNLTKEENFEALKKLVTDIVHDILPPNLTPRKRPAPPTTPPIPKKIPALMSLKVDPPKNFNPALMSLNPNFVFNPASKPIRPSPFDRPPIPKSIIYTDPNGNVICFKCQRVGHDHYECPLYICQHDKNNPPSS